MVDSTSSGLRCGCGRGAHRDGGIRAGDPRLLARGAAVLLLTLIVATTAAAMRRRRPHRKHTAVEPAVRPFGVPPSDVDMPVERCRGLIAEALTIRERMSGQIDAETYQARMKDLAWQASREGRAHRNAR